MPAVHEPYIETDERNLFGYVPLTEESAEPFRMDIKMDLSLPTCTDGCDQALL